MGDAFEESGSSLLTLGFAVDHHGPVVAAMFVEATIGLGLVALLISFLPKIYQQFSRREVLVSQLDVRAGTPPTPVALFRRAELIGWIQELDEFWLEWERWFTEVEESHTSYLSLPFFRSPHPGRSWLTAAGAVLDSAAIRASAIDLPRSWQAQLCLRAGYLAGVHRHGLDVALGSRDWGHEPEARDVEGHRADLDRPDGPWMSHRSFHRWSCLDR